MKGLQNVQLDNVGTSEIRCKVTSVITAKRYFVAVKFNEGETSENHNHKESITCSFESWPKVDLPVPGDIVLMRQVRRTGKGWRAGSAAPVVMEVNKDVIQTRR